MVTALPSRDDIQTEKAERHLYDFTRYAWPIVEGEPMVDGWHIHAICEHLEAVTSGDIRNLIINVPYRHMKSLLVSVFWPAWEWIREPKRRFLTASYAGTLSTRDSVRSRWVIESDWYKKRWGDRFRLTTDQNVKSYYWNDKGGFRIAIGKGGAATGEGGDRIICLEGNTSITTDHGELPINRIVEEALPVRVLGPSGRWQLIEAFEKNPGKALLEIVTENGNILRCTEDHQIFIQGHGWKPARDVIELAHGDVFLYGLQQNIRPAPSACETGKNGAILFSHLFRNIREEQEQSFMDGRIGRVDLPQLQQGPQFETERSQEKAFLFVRLRKAGQAERTAKTMPELRTYLFAEQLWQDVLQPALCRSVSPSRSTWKSKRELQRWPMADSLLDWLSSQPSTTNKATGRETLRTLFRDFSPTSASPRLFYDKSRSNQSGDSLHIVSPVASYSEGLDEPIRVKAIRSLGSPSFVYNLRVVPDHAYYANNILVHNCDDPHNREEITSDTIRKSDAEWVDQTMSTRKNDPKTSATVIIMQRLHEEDLSGHLLAKGGWEHLCLPAEYEKARHCYTSIGWEDPRTEEGELLWPSRFGPKEIEEAKVSLGSMGFAAQMNQNPAPAEGNTIKRAWFRFYKQIPDDLEEIIQSWDMTFKDHKHNDYVAGQVWGRRGGEHQAERYLLDRVNEHLNFPGTVAAIRTMSAKWPRALTKLVEDTANGPAVIASLTNEIPGLIGVSPQGSKEARLASVSPTIEAGNVYLPDPSSAPWVEDYIRQLITFPNGVHDDEVDATSQALLRWLKSAELYFA